MNIPPSSRPDFNFIQQIIEKIVPEASITKKIIYVVVISILIVPEIRGVKIFQSSHSAAKTYIHSDSSISIDELSKILDKPLNNKKQAREHIKELIDLKDHFSYKLLKLELQISRYGNFIATHLPYDNRKAVYKLIQEILSEIQYYNGPLTGDSRTTRAALINFQKDYNRRVDESGKLKSKSLGNFGYRTLEAIRSHYRRVSEP